MQPPLEVNLSTIQTNIRKALPILDIRDKVRTILNEKGAGIEDALEVVACNMRFANDERLRQQAAEKILEYHGLDKNSSGDTTINVICPANVNLANILNPTRIETIEIEG